MMKRRRYNGWLMGLWARDGDPPSGDFLIKADNVIIKETGSIRCRPGFFAYGNYVDDYIIGIFCNSLVYLSTKDKKIIRQTGIPTKELKTYTTGGRGQFIKFNGKYCHSNGSDTPQVWTDISNTSSDVTGSPPMSRILLVHNDRVFASSGNVLYETAVDTGPDETNDNWAKGASWVISPGTNNPIMALGSLGRVGLLIFNRSEIWIQTGYTKQERQTRLLTNDYGCSAPDSVQTLDLEGIGECVVFLATNGKLCAVNLNGVIDIGQNVQNELNSIFKGACVGDAAIPYNEAKHRCVSAVHPDGYYLLGYSKTNNDTEQDFAQCLCVHTKIKPDGGLWPITKWVRPVDPVSPPVREFPMTFAAMTQMYDTARVSVMIGQKTVDGKYQPFTMNPLLYKDEDPYSAWLDELYIGLAIRTINDNFGDEYLFKSFLEAKAWVRSESKKNILISFGGPLVSGDSRQFIDGVVSSSVFQGISGTYWYLLGDYAILSGQLNDSGRKVSLLLVYRPINLSNPGFIIDAIEIGYTEAGYL